MNMEGDLARQANADDTKPPCNSGFFKIIVSPSLQLQYLKIPSAFINKFTKSLLDHAYLRVPDGAKWKVHLKRQEGDVSFDKGWPEFAKHYSLALGHFIVFKYQGNSEFQVIIFDKTGTEIEYAQNTTMNTAVERAKAFESSNPHFSIVVRPSYLRLPFNFRVPVWYAKQQMRREKYFAMRLRVEPTGRTWSVNCHSGGSRHNTRVRWKSFARDNRLEEGDVCVFELIDKKTKTYMVTVFRH